MKPVQPEELSAFLDGELSLERSREVEMQIASDPTLRAEFEDLAGSDALWRTAAATASFEPAVRLPAGVNRLTWFVGFSALMGALIVLRLMPKLIEAPTFGFSLHAIALALLLTGIVWFAQADRRDAIMSPV